MNNMFLSWRLPDISYLLFHTCRYLIDFTELQYYTFICAWNRSGLYASIDFLLLPLGFFAIVFWQWSHHFLESIFCTADIQLLLFVSFTCVINKIDAKLFWPHISEPKPKLSSLMGDGGLSYLITHMELRVWVAEFYPVYMSNQLQIFRNISLRGKMFE